MSMRHRKLTEVEFSEPGTQVEGRLLSYQIVRYKDGGSNVDYLLKRGDGTIEQFKGSAMLNKMLFPEDVGCIVRITFRGLESKKIPEGMSAKKIFEVEVDEDSKQKPVNFVKVENIHGQDIGDDDIPF